MFAQLASDSFFHDKVNMFIACAPIVYLEHTTEDTIKKAADEWKNLFLATTLAQAYEVNDNFLTTFKQLCTQFNDICDYLYDLINKESEYSDDDASRL